MARQRVLLVLPSALLFAALAGPAHAGFFDFLFQRPHSSSPMLEEPAPSDFPSYQPYAPRQAAPHRRVTIIRRNAPEKPEIFAGRTAAILNDATLRDGDAVMTIEGIRIFAGAYASEHRAKDFAALDEVKGLSQAQQSALAEIDAQRPLDDPRTSVAELAQPATGRSVVSGTHPWKWVRDPKGVLLRYVGP